MGIFPMNKETYHFIGQCNAFCSMLWERIFPYAGQLTQQALKESHLFDIQEESQHQWHAFSLLSPLNCLWNIWKGKKTLLFHNGDEMRPILRIWKHLRNWCPSDCTAAWQEAKEQEHKCCAANWKVTVRMAASVRHLHHADELAILRLEGQSAHSIRAAGKILQGEPTTLLNKFNQSYQTLDEVVFISTPAE